MAKHLRLVVLCFVCVLVLALCPALAQTPAEELVARAPIDGTQPSLMVEVESLTPETHDAHDADGRPVKSHGWVARVHVVNRAECDWTGISQLNTELWDANGKQVGRYWDARYDSTAGPDPSPRQAYPNDFRAALQFSRREDWPVPTSLYVSLLRYRALPVCMSWNADGGPLRFPLKEDAQGVRVTVSGVSVEDTPVVHGQTAHEPHAVFRVTLQRTAEDIFPRPFLSAWDLQLSDTDGKQLMGKTMRFSGKSTPPVDALGGEDYSAEVHFDGTDLPAITRIRLAFKQWQRLPSLVVTSPLPEPATASPDATPKEGD